VKSRWISDGFGNYHEAFDQKPSCQLQARCSGMTAKKEFDIQLETSLSTKGKI
jgi:hypothetical protein